MDGCFRASPAAGGRQRGDCRHRDATGEGQHVEVNQLSTLLSSRTLAGAVPGILGNRRPSIAPYEVFGAKDRPIVIAVGNDWQFASLCQGLNHQDLVNDPRFATNTDRVTHVEELAALLAEPLRKRTAADWFRRLMPLGVPCGPVNDLAAAFSFAEDLGLVPRTTITGNGQSMDLVANPIGLLAPRPGMGGARPGWESTPAESQRGWIDQRRFPPDHRNGHTAVITGTCP